MTGQHKIIRLGLAACYLLAAGQLNAASPALCPPSRALFDEMRKRVLAPTGAHVVVVAHRACHSAAPENSTEAIEACWKMGVEVVENDVRRTKDGHLVIIHDGEVDRVTDGYGYVGDMTLAELKLLFLREAGGGPSAMVTNIRISTLEEHLLAAKDKVMVNMELKPADGNSWQSLYEQAIQMARRLGVLDQVLLKVPDVRSHGQRGGKHLLETMEFARDVNLMPIIWQSERPAASRLDQLEPYTPVGYEVPVLDVSYLTSVATDPRIRSRPIMAIALKPYWSGGLDDRAALREPGAAWGGLLRAGATMIMTDRPEYLLSYLSKAGRRAEYRCLR